MSLFERAIEAARSRAPELKGYLKEDWVRRDLGKLVETLEAERDAARSALAAEQDVVLQLANTLEARAAELVAAEERFAQLDGQTDYARKLATEFQAERDAALAKLAAAEARVKELEAEISDRQGTENSFSDWVDKLSEECDAARAALAVAETRANELKRACENHSFNREAAEERVRELSEEFTRAVDALTTERQAHGETRERAAIYREEREAERDRAEGLMAKYGAERQAHEVTRGALAALVELVEMDEDFNNPAETDCYVALANAKAALSATPGTTKAGV